MKANISQISQRTLSKRKSKATNTTEKENREVKKPSKEINKNIPTIVKSILISIFNS
jgi:hypothetical protein